jgi:hypothetical protein
MEREYYQNKLGTILDSKDILRMTRTLFKPAIKECEVNKIVPGITVYSKEYTDDSQHEDGMDYYYSFHAVDDAWRKVKEYNISEEMTEYITLDQLTEDECKQVRLQFRQQYVASGCQITDLPADPSWNALSAPEIFNRVTLSLALTNSFNIKGDVIRKTFSAERRLRVLVGNKEDVVAEYHDTVLDSYHFDDRPLPLDEQVKESDWDPEEYALLDNASDALLAMTTKDREQIIGILDKLQLLTQNKQSSRLFQED